MRWVHLLLGGALLMPYFLLASVPLSFLFNSVGFLTGGAAGQFGTFALALPLAAVSALLFPLIRPLEGAVSRHLLGLTDAELCTDAARSWAARRGTAAYYTLHLLAGGIVSGMSLATPPFAAVLLVLPFFGSPGPLGRIAEPWLSLAPLGGLALLALVVLTSWYAGALLARCAPVLLGPTPEDRVAAAEQRARQWAERNRLARELHDSVGHALSAVLLQASAARKVLDADPEFARQALAAIEETTRDAVGELDTVLGLLREDETASAAPVPTLADLDALLERTRAAGGTVALTAPSGGLERVPPVVSREAYRIVQEGLGNAMRHAGPVPVRLRLALNDDALEVTLENPLGPGPGPAPARRRSGGGRGLTGIAERARLLRGSSSAGEQDGTWRLSVRLPLGGGPL
ncbi:histidine kinase [Streptomyces sp. NPDC049577]|uniref:sensor histidine kinase n=1 Tax=Streptomyces sp. NPDC049577 TaxID=3155153 RepID=UPI003435F054